MSYIPAVLKRQRNAPRLKSYPDVIIRTLKYRPFVPQDSGSPVQEIFRSRVCILGNTPRNGLTPIPLHVIKVSFVPPRQPVMGVVR